MSGEELQDYFNSIFHKESDVSAEEKDVILKLIDITLKFRDELVRNTGETLTVEETKMALLIYQNVLKTGKVPANIEKKIGQLIRRWLERINGKTF
jgi:hypothetical protein